MEVVDRTADEIVDGQLTCPGCQVEIPIRAGFAIFTSAGIAGKRRPESVAGKLSREA